MYWGFLIAAMLMVLLVIIDIDLATRTGVVRFLLHVLGEGPIELAPILATVFLHLVDCPRTRAYIRVGTDLEVGFALVSSCSVRFLMSSLDGTLCDNRCLWQRSGSCRPYARLCKSGTTDATDMERYVLLPPYEETLTNASKD